MWESGHELDILLFFFFFSPSDDGPLLSPPHRLNAKPPVNQKWSGLIASPNPEWPQEAGDPNVFAWSSSARCGSHKGAHAHICTDRGRGWLSAERLTAHTRTQRHTWSDLRTFPPSDYQAHKDIWEQGAGESSRSVSIWQERQGNRDYSLSAIFPINPQMANLQRFNASIICKERDKITLQVWNKTDIMCYSGLLHLDAIFVAFFFFFKRGHVGYKLDTWHLPSYLYWAIITRLSTYPPLLAIYSLLLAKYNSDSPPCKRWRKLALFLYYFGPVTSDLDPPTVNWSFHSSLLFLPASFLLSSKDSQRRAPRQDRMKRFSTFGLHRCSDQCFPPIRCDENGLVQLQ